MFDSQIQIDKSCSVGSGESPELRMSRVNLKSFLEHQDGKFVSIAFKKKDGSPRLLNGRLGVRALLRGGRNTVEAADRTYLTVYDAQVRGYRVVDLATAEIVKANRQTYLIID